MAKNNTTSNGPAQNAPAVAPVSETRSVEELAAENAELQQINSELQSRLEEEAGKKAASVPTVEHDGRKFEVTAPKFNFKGEVLEAANLTPEVIAELVEIGAGVLKEIV